MKKKYILLLVILLLSTATILLYVGCENNVPKNHYQTQNVIIVVVDGARYKETWGDPSHQYIPHRFALLQKGVLCSKFYNNAYTATCPGHEAICTGVYENIDNTGHQYPTNPSIFQYWMKTFRMPSSKAWIITTKDKLQVLSDCVNPDWKGTFRPSTDCGVNGLFTGYREDSITFKKLKLITTNNEVRLAIVNFKQPDAAGHLGDYEAYLQGILDTDNYIYQLWNLLQSNPFYKNKTTLIVTNDHGRHDEGHLDGFVSHGDLCDGCKHIEFFAMGPDFKENYTCSTPYEQIDIASTIAELMGFKSPTSNGKLMKDIFKDNL